MLEGSKKAKKAKMKKERQGGEVDLEYCGKLMNGFEEINNGHLRILSKGLQQRNIVILIRQDGLLQC